MSRQCRAPAFLHSSAKVIVPALGLNAFLGRVGMAAAKVGEASVCGERRPCGTKTKQRNRGGEVEPRSEILSLPSSLRLVRLDLT